MFTYKFVIRKERNNAVMLRLTANRKSSEIGLGISVPSTEVLDEVVKGVASKAFKDQMLVVKRYANAVRDLLEEQKENGGTSPTASQLRQRILNTVVNGRIVNRGVSNGDVVPFFQKRINAQKNPRTVRILTYTLKYIKDFCHDENSEYHRESSSLSFKDISLGWITAFDEWMEGRGLSVNSRWLYLTRFHTIVNKAIDAEIIDRDPFRRFKVHKEKTRKRSLPVDDLRRFFNHTTTEAQEIYLDMFKLIFMLCGINGVDLYNLKGIRNGRVEYRRAKTGTLYSIKVEPEAMEIINKWRGEKNLLCLADRWPDHELFVRATNQQLKRMGRKADGIRHWKGKVKRAVESDLPSVTTYWARHTWATIARKLKIPKDDIALALGHSSGHDMTEIYIDEDTTPIDEANRRVLNYILYDKK